MESLLCLFQERRGVNPPGEVIVTVYTQDLKAGHPLHFLTTDQDGLRVISFLPVVNDQLFGLGGVQDQVVLRQFQDLFSVCSLICSRDERPLVISSANFMMALLGWVGV